MNEYPFGEEENAELDVEPEVENDDSASDMTEVLEGPTGEKISSDRPNKRALRIRRAIELYYERAALKELIDDSFNQP